eukprot:2092531-Pleurochrysis_carterae.AAC.1
MQNKNADAQEDKPDCTCNQTFAQAYTTRTAARTLPVACQMTQTILATHMWTSEEGIRHNAQLLSRIETDATRSVTCQHNLTNRSRP